MSAVQKTVKRLESKGFLRLRGPEEDKLVMGNGTRVAEGKRNPFAIVSTDGSVEYMQESPLPAVVERVDFDLGKAAAVAKATGIGPRAVERWWNGSNSPRLSDLFRVCKAMGWEEPGVFHKVATELERRRVDREG